LGVAPDKELQRPLDLDGLGENARLPIQTNPPELFPIFLIVVHEDGDLRVGGDVAQSLEVGGPFGLGVHREVGL
jgi:hypothetical protein